MIFRALFLLVFLCLISCDTGPKYRNSAIYGNAFGTRYTVQFIANKQINYKTSYDSIVAVINQSMSTYLASSDISKINKGDSTIQVDGHFKKVFKEAKRIYGVTDGAFDPTIGILVNAWDFGPEGEVKALDSVKIDSLMRAVGFDEIQLDQGSVRKQQKNAFLDFNALAKGYAVDVFSEFLESKGIENYIVEIGGEIRAKGQNLIKQKPWKIGVEDPNFDELQSYSKIISLHNEAMATSGSYRKFKLDKDGNRYAHIIDAKTGFPHKSNLLSVSVIAQTCMEADAYATALMSMGLERTKRFLSTHPELKVYLIFENANKELERLSINGFPEN